MRRWTPQNQRYSVEFEPALLARLGVFGERLRERIADEMEALAELADLAPLSSYSAAASDDSAPRLHATVDDSVVTYVVERHARRIRVVDVSSR